MATVTYHIGVRGYPGFTTGDVSGTRFVIPAMTLVDSSGNEVAISGGGSGAAAGQVQGNGASAATAVGNPVRVAGTTVTADPTYTDGQTANLRVSTKGNLYTTAIVTATLADGANNSGGMFADTSNIGRIVTFGGTHFNGTSWDRARGDTVSAYSRNPPRTKTDSAVVAASTTSQQLFAANTSRSKFLIQNQDAAINLFYNVGAAATAAAPSMRIAPGATVELTGTSGAVNIIAVTGTPPVAGWEL